MRPKNRQLPSTHTKLYKIHHCHTPRNNKPGGGIGNRPPSPKPKDPSELNIEDPELANDYRKMYERFTEMEAKMALLLQKDLPEKDFPDGGDR